MKTRTPNTKIRTTKKSASNAARKSERVLNWLHISDLHFRAGDEYNSSIVLDSLLRDIEMIRNTEKFSPDLVFITGDLAYSGKPQEYERAAVFLSQLVTASGVPLERMICVPGNHDVDRSRITTKGSKIAGSLTDRDSVSRVIGDPATLAALTDRHQFYSSFVKQSFPWASRLNSTRLSQTFNMVVNGVRLSILALNSAWTAGVGDDKGKVIIGERQVREALEGTKNPELVIALFHHPLSYLTDFDSSCIRPLLEGRCDFVLHGHVHELGVVNMVSPDSAMFYMAAGASYTLRSEVLNYNAASLDLGGGIGKALLRHYSDRRQKWLPDTEFYEAAPTGILTFTLPERLTHLPQPADLAEVRTLLRQFASPKVKSTLAPDLEYLRSQVPKVPAALIESIQKGDCLLFAGAGASVDAKLPNWRELILRLLERLQHAGTVTDQEVKELLALVDAGDWLISADFCRNRLGKHDFAECLKNGLSDLQRSSRTHRLFSAIPFRAAVTTNFDPFLEHSRQPSRVFLPHEMQSSGAQGVDRILADRHVFPVIKIHGSYDDVDSIILTQADFRKVLFEMPKYREFLSRLFSNSTLFFYGYGFKDTNVDFVLQELMALYNGAARPHYALMPNPGAIKQEYLWRGYNIRVIPYEVLSGSHLAAINFLEQLAKTCGRTPITPIT